MVLIRGGVAGAVCLGLLSCGAQAGFNAGATNNVVVYWGQNSINRVSGGQERLATYCSNPSINVIPLAFLHLIKNTGVNFANAGDNCTTFANQPGLLDCPQIEDDIKTCQSLGKTILLSIGGATYTEGGFSSASEAEQWANTIWAMFGPVPGSSGPQVNRPFGTAVVDGFDLDLEAVSLNMVPFANRLRSLMNAAGGKQYYLSAAPQCPFPDAAMGEVLSRVPVDMVNVQFYNNYCGSQSYDPSRDTQFNFNFQRWNEWATNESPNRAVKVLLGMPGSPTAAGGGFVVGDQLRNVIQYSKAFSSFGGVMLWDMSQIYGNAGYLDTITAYLGGNAPPPASSTVPSPPTPTPSSSSTATPSTATSSVPTPTGGLVPQWGQCGGREWTGPTVCAPPWTCRAVTVWWSHCN